MLTLPELLALAEAMPRQHQALTLLAGLCGLRFGEAVALRRRDVDLERGIIHVTRTAVRTRRHQDDRSSQDGCGPTIGRDAQGRRRRAARPTSLSSQSRTGTALIFPGRDGAQLAHSALYGLAGPDRAPRRTRLPQGTVRLHGAREVIGKPGLHWHDLRRTAATLGAQAGATVREMQSRLGHSTPNMALYYQGATAERDRSIADRLQAQVEAVQGANAS